MNATGIRCPRNHERIEPVRPNRFGFADPIMNVTLLPPGHPSWNTEIERLGIRLHAGENPTLFPYHFLSVVLQRIGGYLASFSRDEREVGAGFLFPRWDAGGPAYTLRYHQLHPDGDILPTTLTTVTAQSLHHAKIVYYDPTAPQQYSATGEEFGAVNIGRPTQAEAEEIRIIQQEVWGSPPESLYPVDIHSDQFAMATSLVARVEGKLAGFLFGVNKFGGPPLPDDWHVRFNGSQRIESQTMGVLPGYRGMRIGFLLKKTQAAQAWKQGIGVINWTVDPLQFPNAALNLGLLRGLAYNFYPDLYPFRNELNRVVASRFAITWIVGSKHVRDVPLFGSKALILDLTKQRNVAIVNRGWTDVNYSVNNAVIAIEIPNNWTALQQAELEQALAWREVTDRIFAHYLGSTPGKYVLTGVGVRGERRYLIGEQVNEEIWQHLGRY